MRTALDVSVCFIEGFRHGGFKAKLATNHKRGAIRYLECLERLGDLRCAVVVRER